MTERDTLCCKAGESIIGIPQLVDDILPAVEANPLGAQIWTNLENELALAVELYCRGNCPEIDGVRYCAMRNATAKGRPAQQREEIHDQLIEHFEE